MIEIKEKESNQLERDRILDKAYEIINGERQGTYGSAEDSFGRIAEFWTTYTGNYISAIDVANMMVLMKIARNASGVYKDDNWIDICGYAALGGEIQKKAYDDRSTVKTMYMSPGVEIAKGVQEGFDWFSRYMNKPVEDEHDDRPDAINRLINIANEVRYSEVVTDRVKGAENEKSSDDDKQWFTLDNLEKYPAVLAGTYLSGVKNRYSHLVYVSMRNNNIERFVYDVASAYNFGFVDGKDEIIKFVNTVGKLFRSNFPSFSITVQTAVEIIGMCYLHIIIGANESGFDIYSTDRIERKRD